MDRREIAAGNRGKPMEQTDDRRRTIRYPVDLEAEVQIVRPEETFTPMTLDGKIIDLSLRGARIALRRFPQREYLQLVKQRKPPYVSLFCSFPPEQDRSRLFGLLTYIDYRGEKNDPACNLGISFGEMEQKDIDRLDGYLDQVQSQS
jgi:hypothetical protein